VFPPTNTYQILKTQKEISEMAFAAARMIKDKKDQEQKQKRPVEARCQSKVRTFGVVNILRGPFVLSE
jgi:hypothetical protein